jgi:hypothetical protein
LGLIFAEQDNEETNLNDSPYNFDPDASKRALDNMGVAWSRRLKRNEGDRERLASQLDDLSRAYEFKRCQKCDEEIRVKAQVCKHCGHDQIDQVNSGTTFEKERIPLSTTGSRSSSSCSACGTDYIVGFNICRCSIGLTISEIEFGFLERFGFEMPDAAYDYWVKCGEPSLEDFDWVASREYARRNKKASTQQIDAAKLGKSILKGLFFTLASGGDHFCNRCGQRLTGALCRYCQQ